MLIRTAEAKDGDGVTHIDDDQREVAIPDQKQPSTYATEERLSPLAQIKTGITR